MNEQPDFKLLGQYKSCAIVAIEGNYYMIGKIQVDNPGLPKEVEDIITKAEEINYWENAN